MDLYKDCDEELPVTRCRKIHYDYTKFRKVGFKLTFPTDWTQFYLLLGKDTIEMDPGDTNNGLGKTIHKWRKSKKDEDLMLYEGAPMGFHLFMTAGKWLNSFDNKLPSCDGFLEILNQRLKDYQHITYPLLEQDQLYIEARALDGKIWLRGGFNSSHMYYLTWTDKLEFTKFKEVGVRIKSTICDQPFQDVSLLMTEEDVNQLKTKLMNFMSDDEIKNSQSKWFKLFRSQKHDGVYHFYKVDNDPVTISGIVSTSYDSLVIEEADKEVNSVEYKLKPQSTLYQGLDLSPERLRVQEFPHQELSTIVYCTSQDTKDDSLQVKTILRAINFKGYLGYLVVDEVFYKDSLAKIGSIIAGNNAIAKDRDYQYVQTVDPDNLYEEFEGEWMIEMNNNSSRKVRIQAVDKRDLQVNINVTAASCKKDISNQVKRYGELLKKFRDLDKKLSIREKSEMQSKAMGAWVV